MKHALLSIALTSAAFGTLPTAHAADSHNGFFINGNVGQSNLDVGLADDGTGFGTNVGYRWAVSPNVLLGVEGGYTDLGSSSGEVVGTLVLPLPESGSSSFLYQQRVDLTGWNAGVNGHFNIADNWYISGRTGLFRAKFELHFPGPGYSSTSNQWYAGTGVGYDFNSNVSVGLNYDYYTSDGKASPSLLSVSSEYRF